MPSPTTKTVYSIINDAMHDAGFLETGELPNSQQLADNFRRLNDIINLWQTGGLKLFLNETVDIPIVAGTSLYQLNGYKRVLMGNVITPESIRRPLVVMSWYDWMRLSQTSNLGMISSYFVDKQVPGCAIRVWNTPDTSEEVNILQFLTQVEVTNPINLEEDMDFPQEWRIALRWGLADDICTGQPQAIMDRCAMRAKVYREALEDWDVEDAPTQFAVDNRGTRQTGRFR